MARYSKSLEELMEEKYPENSCRSAEFTYIVQIIDLPPLCFGTTKPRSTSPIGKNLSPHQKRVTFENFPKLGPGRYNLTKEWKSSKARSTVVVDEEEEESLVKLKGRIARATRFLENADKISTPPASKYDLSFNWGQVKKNKTPFNSTGKQTQFEINKLPGPTTYNLRCFRQCRRPLCTYAFGKPKTMKCVETLCLPKLIHKCLKCRTLCEGDYWHIPHHNIYLCILCKMEEMQNHEEFSTEELKQFVVMRSCDSMHYHNNSKTGLTIRPWHKVIQKIRMENYLSLYLKWE